MPVTASELADAGKKGLDYYVKNNPIDQIAVERPILRKLMSGKKTFPGGKQYVIEQLRYRYQSNFQWYYGDQEVTYNKRQSIEQAQFEWRSCHDGYSLNEDDFLRNGIIVADGPPKRATGSEWAALTDLFQESNDILRLGFEEKFDQELTIDGSADAEALEGLDHLVQMAPATGTVGSLNAATYDWWRNYSVWNDASATKQVAVTSSNLISEMDIAWRKCIRNGGLPNCILMGSAALDTFRTAAKGEISRYTILKTSGQEAGMDPTIGPVEGVQTGLHFHNVPITWVPTFEDLDGAYPSASPDWEKRFYILNSKHIRLRPAKGHDMVTRNPPRVYNRYAYYWGLSWKGALCTGRRNAHACGAVD